MSTSLKHFSTRLCEHAYIHNTYILVFIRVYIYFYTSIIMVFQGGKDYHDPIPVYMNLYK